MKRGNQVFIRALLTDCPDERAVIVKRDQMPGWFVVQFDNGDRLCVHESRIAA